jgi:iron complex transport system permease protein
MTGFLPSFLTGFYLIPLWGFAGAMLASFLVLLLMTKQNQLNNSTFLLIGVAVSMMANSLLSLLTFWASRQNEVRHLLFWTFGNLDKANWESLGLGTFFSGLGLLALWTGRRLWTILLLGDEKAASLGISVGLAKRILLLIGALLTSSIVCLVGPIGFVGLIVPFWLRKWIPISNQSFWPATFFTGSAFLALCDLVSRLLYQPIGLPIGLITSLIGVPFFLYLLRDTTRKTSF